MLVLKKTSAVLWAFLFFLFIGLTGCKGPTTPTTTKKIIEFDSATVKCHKSGGINLSSGDEILESDTLVFTAILAPGKIVEKWYLNGTRQTYETDSTYYYKVKASDVVSGKITVSVVSKIGAKGTIEFDSATVTCRKSGGTNLSSGDKILESDWLVFTAILAPGKIVENWYLNGTNQTYATYSTYWYKVEASDFVSGKITVSVVLK